MAAPREARSRRALLAVLLLGALLRIYPLHRPYQHPEQDVVPRSAILEVVRGDWEPAFLFHGSAFVYVLRVLYTGWYAVGKAFGAYADRLDLLTAFVRDPFPFFVVGRLVVFVCSVLTLYLVGRLAWDASGGAAGVAATGLLAVTFIHVRESHHVWYDVPAAAAVVAAVGFAVRGVRRGSATPLALAGALGGAAIACKHSVFPVALPVALAAAMAAAATIRVVVARGLVATAAALGVYVILSPYSLLQYRLFIDSARFTTAAIMENSGTEALPFATLWWAGIGWGVTGLAVVGLIGAIAREPRAGIVLGAFPVATVTLLAIGGRLHARYLAPVAPLVALLAGVGATTLGGLLWPRRRALAAAILTVLVGFAPAAQSLAYVRVLGRRDTRQLAADWIQAHVPRGTPLTVPSLNRYPNPLLPWDATLVRITYREWADVLLGRGVADPRQIYPQRYLGGVFGGFPPDWQPRDRFVVTAYHPIVVRSARIPAAYIERLRAAGARPVAAFDGFREPLDGTVYDPIDADYVPLTGFGRLERPGPNITIWELPSAVAR